MRRLLAVLVFAALALAALPHLGQARSSRGARWSPTKPAVNETHVFSGGINRRGKPVGFHSRPGGRNPPDARVARIVDGPNRRGVYVAQVEIRTPDGRWLRKNSTFYPDAMDRAAVVAAVLRAYKGRSPAGPQKFRGPSGRGFTIEGYLLDDGRINTAYPIYTDD